MKTSQLVGGGLTLIVAAVLAFVVPRPRVDNSAESFLRGADDQAFARYARFLETFGSDELIVLELEGPADDALAVARRFEHRLATQPGIVSVTGFPTLFEAQTDILLDPELGGFENLDRLRPMLEGPANRALRLFDPVRGHTLSLLTLERAPPEARASLRDELDALRAEATEVGLQLRMAGNPLVNLALDQAGRDLETSSLPLLVVTCTLLLLLFTSNLRTSIATLAVVGLAVFGSEGLLGLTGQSSNLIVGISKPLVFVILLASALHLLVEYENGRAAGLSSAEASAKAVRSKARGTFLALLTTAVGFGAMLTAPVDAMRAFGAVTAGTLVLGAALLIFGLPTITSLLGGAPATGLGRSLEAFTEAIVEWSARRAWIVPLAALICLLGVSALHGLRPDPHAIRYLSAEHPLRKDHEALERNQRPLSSLELVFSSTSTTLDQETLVTLDELRQELEANEPVMAVIDATLLLREGQHRASGLDQLPDALFVREALESEAPRFRAFWSPSTGRLRMSLLIPTLDAPAVHALENRIQLAFARTLGARGFAMELTGNHALIVAAQDALLSTLLTSLLLTTLVLQVVLFIGLGSFRLGFIALLPNLLPVTVNFGLMKLLSIPLDVGTSMTAAIALGIAVDDTLHFILTHRELSDLRATARTTGRALVSSSVIIGIGFLVLLPSDFSPTRNFGILCASAMLTALIGNLVVLPRLLRRWSKEAAPTGQDAAS